ncbi:helix-turn-helix transcriptional regulator [Methylobacterium oryzae]|uniref:Transcriptional regulator n=1 Tax=Methylobacterium oryzae TaxID=334852 RepID=A0ABU7TNT2_9HYPH
MSEATTVPGPKRCTDLDARIGGRIRIARERARMSQTSLGDALGISFQQVQKYEQGKNRIGAANLQRVADLLKVPVEAFFDGPAAIEAPPPPTVEQAWAEHRAATKALEDALQREAAALQVAA